MEPGQHENTKTFKRWQTEKNERVTYSHYNYNRSCDTWAYDFDRAPVFVAAHGDGSWYDG